MSLRTCSWAATTITGSRSKGGGVPSPAAGAAWAAVPAAAAPSVTPTIATVSPCAAGAASRDGEAGRLTHPASIETIAAAKASSNPRRRKPPPKGYFSNWRGIAARFPITAPPCQLRAGQAKDRPAFHSSIDHKPTGCPAARNNPAFPILSYAAANGGGFAAVANATRLCYRKSANSSPPAA